MIRSEKGFININNSLYYTEKLIEEKKVTTTDIFENRFVKYMIQQTIKRLKPVKVYLNPNDERENNILTSIKKKIKILEMYLNRYFQDITNLTGNKSMSLVFQMAPGYKEMYKKYIMLNKGLDLGMICLK